MSIIRYLRALLNLALVGVTCGYAGAQSCSNYLFPGEAATVVSARISVERAPIMDGDSCPNLSAGCGSKAYLVRGDVVFESRLMQGTHTCVAFFNGKRQTTGWVETKSLASSPIPTNKGDWLGRWKRVTGNTALTVRRGKDGSYQAEALATYAVTQNNVRTGTAEGKLLIHTANGGVSIASFGDPGPDRTAVCRVNLRQFGPWLLVDDGATDDSNSACGGMGVTLNGIYRRAERVEAKP